MHRRDDSRTGYPARNLAVCGPGARAVSKPLWLQYPTVATSLHFVPV